MLYKSELIRMVEDILKNGCTKEQLEEVGEFFEIEILEFKTEEEQKAFFQGMKFGLLVDEYSIDYYMDL